MIGNTFYTEEELRAIPFKHLGTGVRISRLACIADPTTIELHDHVRIDNHTFLGGNIILRKYVHIGHGAGLYGIDGIEFDEHSGTSPRASVFSSSEDFKGRGFAGPDIPNQFRKPHRGRVYIGKFCILGPNSVVLPHTTMEEGSCLLPLSLGIGPLKSWMLYKGNPATAILERRREAFMEQYERCQEYWRAT